MVEEAGLSQAADEGKEGAQKQGAAPPIHVPAPSLWPSALGLGVALLLFGVLSQWAFSVAGAALFAWALASWISQLRQESAQHEQAQHEPDEESPHHEAHAQVDRMDG